MTVDPRIVAHRGWTRDSTENTVEALAAAASLGCASVEFDVRVTLDGVWVMHHDPDLLRIHQIERRIANSKFDELRAVAPVATLEEALEALPVGCRPMVEVKEYDVRHFEALARDLDRATRLEPIVIVRGEMPREARRVLPDVSIYLYELDWQHAYSRRNEPIDGYDLRHDPVPNDRMEDECQRFAAAGKKLAVWTVNDPMRAQRWLEAGVDWLITDHPEQFPGS